jgi:hypothetical protein
MRKKVDSVSQKRALERASRVMRGGAKKKTKKKQKFFFRKILQQAFDDDGAQIFPFFWK